MMDIRAKDLPLPFAAFMDRLKAMGFVIGVDQYLRLQTVLKGFGPEADPRRLKYRLCPIFAVNARQQEQFYRAFDLFFPLPGPDGAPVEFIEADREPGEDAPEPVKLRRTPYILAAALWVVLIAILAFQWAPAVEVEKAGPTVTQQPAEEPGPDQVEREPDIVLEIPLKTTAPTITFYQKYGHAIRWILILAPIVIGVLWEWRRAARRRWAIHHGKGAPPAHYLPVSADPPPPTFLKDRRFYNAARRMRRRVAFEGRRLDIPRTVDRTLRNRGFPQPAYRGLTRPPEYLFLIDLSAPDDHYARLCETFAGALKNEGVFVTRLFYVQDPQVLFFTDEGERLYLSDLIHRYDRHRLILVGDGDALLNPVSGRLERWSRVFGAWEERALLTYNPPGQWGMREAALAAEFVLLPATLAGLEAVVRYFETPLRYHIGTWVRGEAGMGAPFDPESVEVNELEAYMGAPEDFLWLAACAVYPDLNWGLTLRLAIDLDYAVTADAVLKLVRLPWFRGGVMPENLRRRLIARMDEETLKTVRKSLLSSIEENLQTDEAQLQGEQRLLLFLHRWMVSGDRRRDLKETQKLIDRVGEDRILEDHTLLDVLSSEKASPLALILPERWHRFFFRKGISWFGLRAGVRMAMVGVLAVGLLFGVRKPEAPSAVTEEAVSFTFAHVPADSFIMGAHEGAMESSGDESRHEVILTQDFYLQTTEVTQGQWKAVMGENPSYFDRCGDDCPVENVSWEDAQAFIKRLNELEPNGKYRLPTEAEWEYAAKSGDAGDVYAGTSDAKNLDQYANFCDKNCELSYRSESHDDGFKNTAPVGSLKPNGFGLYDMSGNVWEWCQDWYGEYPEGPVENPTGPAKGADRVVRGGSWVNGAWGCRSAFRNRDTPVVRDDFLGFRLSRSYP